MKTRNRRKGATRIADVDKDVLASLEAGESETATLAEALAIDFGTLLSQTLGDDRFAGAVPSELGITKRMALAAQTVSATLGEDARAFCQTHASDTLRGWGAFVVAGDQNSTLRDLLSQIKPFADDHHFAVREWAWLAIRPQLAEQLEDALRLLQPWAEHSSANLRRFACEALRPRGVWCAHIKALKEKPELAESLINTLRADPDRYVQDSVGNWLNDAYKTRPDWVQSLCATWLSESDNTATQYTVKRALRSAKHSTQ